MLLAVAFSAVQRFQRNAGIGFLLILRGFVAVARWQPINNKNVSNSFMGTVKEARRFGLKISHNSSKTKIEYQTVNFN